ncbi:MAG: hypothetical protein U0228_04640 [Myxococcaceae bacterium]
MARPAWFVSVACVAAWLAGCQTPCAADTDCESGQRCNTALKVPACQVLYSGGAASPCSTGVLCASRSCVSSACSTPGEPPRLGQGTAALVTYNPTPQGQVTAVFFSDDARNDCSAVDAGTQFGKNAVLVISATPPLVEGQVLTWVTDASARTGTAVKPFVVFSRDDLSGLSLTAVSGTATITHLPAGSDRTFSVKLLSSTGSIDATYDATPICP